MDKAELREQLASMIWFICFKSQTDVFGWNSDWETTKTNDQDTALEMYENADNIIRLFDQHTEKRVAEAELKGMEAVNSCHGCVDQVEYLSERRAELLKQLQDTTKIGDK